ncbi:MAG: lactonase family protein [Rikenellaceae bacterium]|nr:lactonase family protein [Rikenellaceae bacterium]
MPQNKHKTYLLAVGTYTDGAGEGIYVYVYDPQKEVFEKKSAVKVTNSSYLYFSADGRNLYAVTENTETSSYANCFRFEPETASVARNDRRITKGSGPCHIAVDPENRFAVTANYAGGSISVFPLWPDGGLRPLSQLIRFSGKGKNPERQQAPHIHCVQFSPDGRFLFATDLGTDHLYRFDIDRDNRKYFLREESQKAFPVESGSGPRHFGFSPDGRFVYLINELTATVMVFSYQEGELSWLQTLPVKPGAEAEGGDIVITPDGKYLYASLREGEDGIGAFAVDPHNGMLSSIGYIPTARHPRNLSLTPDGLYLFCAAIKENVIVPYSIDPATGKLSEKPARLDIPAPACVLFA